MDHPATLPTKPGSFLDRRQFLTAATGVTAGVTANRLLAANAAAAVPRSKSPARPPNILYIFTDQQFAGAMSCIGNPHVKTPAIDSLAERGMLFTETYCASPVCSPSRGSMLTGLCPHQHGVRVNNTRIRSDLKDICIEHLLGARGYECVYAGKWHLAASRTIAKAERKQHPYRVISELSDVNVSGACARFFGEKRDRPFFLIASYLNPHDICLWARGQRRGLQKQPVPRVSLDRCPRLPGNFRVPHDEPEVLRQFYMTRHSEQKSFSDETWRHYLHAYYWMIEVVDAEIGKLLDALRANGLEENTLIFFSSDHGDGMAAHQWLGKCCHYEEAMRVPFIVSYKDMIKPGRVDRAHLVTNGPDFYATALDYAGAEVPNGCQGMSLRRLLEATGDTHAWRDQVVSEIWVPGNSPRRGQPWKSAWGRMLRTPRFKYAVYDRGKNREQLHDMQNDRGEMHNLAAEPASAGVLAEHRRRLAAWCSQTKDTTFAPHLLTAGT